MKGMGLTRFERNRDSFMVKVSSKDIGTQAGYKVALNNLANFCMEKYGKADFISELKEANNEQVFDFLQAWINWNKDRSPRTVVVLFSRIKKYLHYRGIKLDLQDIKEELDFPRIIEEELYPMTLDDIQRITNLMQYKQKTQFICQLSSSCRIGEIVQLRKKNLITDKSNIIVKIPASIAKFSKGRTTFFSKEASKLLKPLLKEMDDEDLVFGSNENVHHSEVNSEQILKRILIKLGLDMRYESNNRYYINTHSFRAYGITKIARHDPNFSKKLSGQKGYLLQYDRMNDEEKLELYEKFEIDLVIDDTEKQKAEIKRLESEKSELEKIKRENEIMQDSDLMRKIIKEELMNSDSADVAGTVLIKEMGEKMEKLFVEYDKIKKQNKELKKKLKNN